ncbi:hypothetical protein D9M72_478700 [compost metagenome]
MRLAWASGTPKRSAWMRCGSRPASRSAASASSIIEAGPQTKAASMSSTGIRVCRKAVTRAWSSRPCSRSTSCGWRDSTW